MTKTYNSYINSSKWNKIKNEYLQKHPKDELIIWKNKVKANDVHHLSYENLGNEKNMDLCSVCSDTHELLHSYFAPELILQDENLALVYSAGNKLCRFYYFQNEYENQHPDTFKKYKKLTVKLLDYIMNKYFDDVRAKNMIENEYPKSNKFIQYVLLSVLRQPDGNEAIADIYRFYKNKIEKTFFDYMSKDAIPPKEETPSQDDDEFEKIKNNYSIDEIQMALKLYILIKNVKNNKHPIVQKNTNSEKSQDKLLKDGHFNHYSVKQLVSFFNKNKDVLRKSKNYMGNWYQETTNAKVYFNGSIGANTPEKFLKYLKNNGENATVVLKNYLNKNY